MAKAPHDFQNIVILTGAGISADSGIKTFRDAGGLWENYRIEEVATPEAFQEDPHLVWKFYSMRRLQAAAARPNPAHEALVKYAAEHSKKKITLITQNVDHLHQQADPAEKLPPICMHGSLNQSRCFHCGMVYFDDYAYFDLQGNYAPQETALCDSGQRASTAYLHQYRLEFKQFLPLSPCCKALLRPHIVWFGEVPLNMEKIMKSLSEADLFVSIGTSGLVYPAAGFLQVAKSEGAQTVCLNKELIPQNQWIDEFIEGPAGLTVPQFFKKLT